MYVPCYIQVFSGFYLTDFVPEIIIEWMRNKFRRLVFRKLLQVFQNLLTHGNKPVDRFYKIPGKNGIAGSFFMRNDIIGDTDNLGMLVFFDSSQNRSQTRTHERKPVSDNDYIRP